MSQFQTFTRELESWNSEGENLSYKAAVDKILEWIHTHFQARYFGFTAPDHDIIIWYRVIVGRKVKVVKEYRLTLKSFLIVLHILLYVLFMFQIQPYPTEESLQQKLQDMSNWDAFKTMTVTDHMLFNKYVHDTLYL
jgi:hypothetical protein